METLSGAAAFFTAKRAHETDPADLAAARRAGAGPLVIDVMAHTRHILCRLLKLSRPERLVQAMKQQVARHRSSSTPPRIAGESSRDRRTNEKTVRSFRGLPPTLEPIRIETRRPLPS